MWREDVVLMPAPDTDGLRWYKSSRSSANGACVEVADLVTTVAVRDSKDPAGPQLRFGLRSWRTFIGSVRAGTFDGP